MKRTKQTRHPTTPCASCPYRQDAPLGHWHRHHFEEVLESEARYLGGALFHCHGHVGKPPGERGLCAGFLLDQKRRGIPSISMRMQLLVDEEVREAFEAVHAPRGIEMFTSARAMCEANLEEIDKATRRR